MAQHKWHKEIKAWADGAEIEFRYENDGYWAVTISPQWGDSDVEYRIKPQPVEPQYLYVSRHPQDYSFILSEYFDSGKFYVGKIPLIVESNDD